MESDQKTGVGIQQIDETYEFCAPRFFDFTTEETEDQIKAAELWFEISDSYAPSPFMPKIREGRSVQITSLCDFDNVGKTQTESLQVDDNKIHGSTTTEEKPRSIRDLIAVYEVKLDQEKETKEKKKSFGFAPETKFSSDKTPIQEENSPSVDIGASSKESFMMAADKVAMEAQPCSPKAEKVPLKVDTVLGRSKKQAAKKIANTIRKTSSGKVVNKCPLSNNIIQDNQAIKKQKLDCQNSRKIFDVKNRILPHKSKPEPYISTAEIVKKFQSSTRDIGFPQKKSASHESVASIIQKRPRLKLTRPKEPDFVTSQRTRVVKVKSTAELEEEMLAKIPKFKARPVNKKILEAPTHSCVPRSTPKPIEFKEFHLRTMDRANLHMESSSVSSDLSSQNHNMRARLNEPQPPRLQTTLRARPTKFKSSQELELEELGKVPKFKARPLNKKIFDQKEKIQILKPHITVPCKFHFATDDRLGPPLAVADMFDKERGAEKEKQFEEQVLKKQMEEESARIRKANPYPYTTDYPVIPPRPEPKKCTKPETFQLESLRRHEVELQKKMEEKEKMEKEEEQKRLFIAQPRMKYDQFPVKKIERKPLTDVQEFKLHVNQRAAERSGFDKKIKEKEIIYKRMRDENESAKLIEEEKELKQMRRELVPHARPLPKFNNPFLPQKSLKSPTKPQSPILRVGKRGETRKHAYLR